MKVCFTHPHRSDTFEADVAPECTGKAAIEGLIDAKFLEQAKPSAYDLAHARTSTPVGANATLASCGVQEHDVINVVRSGSGA
ncbi:MAG TPA: hypothetical protein VH592_09505 [Gemmataceae bacterium]|jgi:hypothetical protein